jgi:hypothetical protein
MSEKQMRSEDKIDESDMSANKMRVRVRARVGVGVRVRARVGVIVKFRTAPSDIPSHPTVILENPRRSTLVF